jgi:hypothetical protein
MTPAAAARRCRPQPRQQGDLRPTDVVGAFFVAAPASGRDSRARRRPPRVVGGPYEYGVPGAVHALMEEAQPEAGTAAMSSKANLPLASSGSPSG